MGVRQFPLREHSKGRFAKNFQKPSLEDLCSGLGHVALLFVLCRRQIVGPWSFFGLLFGFKDFIAFLFQEDLEKLQYKRWASFIFDQFVILKSFKADLNFRISYQQ